MSMNDEKLAADIAATSPFEVIIEKLKQQARDGWKGQTGEGRAAELDTFIRDVVTEYAAAMQLSELTVLALIEQKRSYSAVNYYQRANFPHLKDVRVFDTLADLQAAVPSRQFRCPGCGGVSTDSEECTAGTTRDDGTTCNWKAYGFLRCMGKGVSILVKDQFHRIPRPIEIFMPLEFEESAAATA